MKKLLITAALCLICLASFATGQVHDKVLFKGKVWEMTVPPLYSLSETDYNEFQKLLGERNYASSANYRGYVAHWIVKGRYLYLDKIEVMEPNGKKKEIDKKLLKETFRKFIRKGRIRAEWMTGTVIIGKGVGPMDPKNPYAPSFLEKNTLTIKQGKIKR